MRRRAVLVGAFAAALPCWLSTVGGTLACSAPQRPLSAGESPNIVLVFVRGEYGTVPESVARQIPLFAAVPDPSLGIDVALTSIFEPDDMANSLPNILRLYGYSTAADFPAASAARLGFSVAAEQPWIKSATEPYFWVGTETGSAAAARWESTEKMLRESGQIERTLVAFVWSDAKLDDATSWWRGPAVPPALPLGAVASTIDIAPTLFTAAKATIPSDSAGVSLFSMGADRTVVFGRGPTGFVAHSDGAQLSIRGEDPLPPLDPDGTELPESVLAGSVFRDDRGERPLAREEGRELYAAILAWRARETAEGARGKMGAERFDTLNAEQGYWQ